MKGNGGKWSIGKEGRHYRPSAAAQCEHCPSTLFNPSTNWITSVLLFFGDQITSGQLYVRADDTMRLDMSDRINMNITATNGCNVFTHKRRILKGAICKKKVDFWVLFQTRFIWRVGNETQKSTRLLVTFSEFTKMPKWLKNHRQSLVLKKRFFLRESGDFILGCR